MRFELDDSTSGAVNHYFRKRIGFEWNEEFFLGAISSARSKYDVYWSVIALRKVGTSRAIPYLKELILYPMSDVKSCAVLTISQIAKATETEFYAGTLLNPKYREKSFAMWAIEDAADERAIPAVVEYLKKNLGKIRSNFSSNRSLHKETVLDAGRYLLRFARTNPLAREMLSILDARLSSEGAQVSQEIASAGAHGYPAFWQMLLTYLNSLVPYWRVFNDAWPLNGGSHLHGFGVLRNSGVDLLVVPWNADDPDLAASIVAPRKGSVALEGDCRLVVVDDRENQLTEDIAHRVSPVKVVLWSQRESLRSCICKEEPYADVQTI